MTHNRTDVVEGVVFWLAMSLFLVLSMGEYYLTRGGGRTLFVIGISLIVFPAAISSPALYALKKFGKQEVKKGVRAPTALVRQNVYALVRHPQYLGLMMMTIGFMAIYQHVISTACGFFSILFFYFQIEKEEEYCLNVFAEEYRRYALAVPKFNIIAGIWRFLQKKSKPLY